MKSLFILQLVCCVITAMLALQLAMASLQVRWKVWRYEISRWILVASMLFFSVHYLLQMIHIVLYPSGICHHSLHNQHREHRQQSAPLLFT